MERAAQETTPSLWHYIISQNYTMTENRLKMLNMLKSQVLKHVKDKDFS